ncbi:MAG: glycosyltransferase family 4 protein, partial [Lentisphaeria bacterium]|nr:glycosyltransferase family 4 protein [Lentisphaeria bacterium]
MNIVFLSNYFNHHQQPFSDAMYKRLGDGYRFVETAQMSQERKNMGWGVAEYPSYVIRCAEFYQNRAVYQQLIDQADVVIIGSAPEELIVRRNAEKKLIFRYSERPFKKSRELWKYPVRFVRYRQRKFDQKHIHMLCASAYTAGDYGMYGLFRNRCYKWGYFPATKTYADVPALIEQKDPASILWVGRLIGLKHPELTIAVAKRLKAEGYAFSLCIIGNGNLGAELQARVVAEQLDDCVFLLGAKKPEEVRRFMERAEIYLFTSDRNEGWGAMLNESMNSACAVVASHAIGSVPFLIEDRKNGMIYEDGNADDLYQKVKWLLDHPQERKQLGANAYASMVEEWNAENAAEKFLALAERVRSGVKHAESDYGVCSKAKR